MVTWVIGLTKQGGAWQPILNTISVHLSLAFLLGDGGWYRRSPKTPSPSWWVHPPIHCSYTLYMHAYTNLVTVGSLERLHVTGYSLVGLTVGNGKVFTYFLEARSTDSEDHCWTLLFFRSLGMLAACPYGSSCYTVQPYYVSHSVISLVPQKTCVILNSSKFAALPQCPSGDS